MENNIAHEPRFFRGDKTNRHSHPVPNSVPFLLRKRKRKKEKPETDLCCSMVPKIMKRTEEKKKKIKENKKKIKKQYQTGR